MKKLLCLFLLLLSIERISPSTIDVHQLVGNDNDKCCYAAYEVSCADLLMFNCPPSPSDFDYACTCAIMQYPPPAGLGTGDYVGTDCSLPATNGGHVLGYWHNNSCEDNNNDDCHNLHPITVNSVLVDKCIPNRGAVLDSNGDPLGPYFDYCFTINCPVGPPEYFIYDSFGCWAKCEYTQYAKDYSSELHPLYYQSSYQDCDPSDDDC